jgi:hypothetical protein
MHNTIHDINAKQFVYIHFNDTSDLPGLRYYATLMTNLPDEFY